MSFGRYFYVNLLKTTPATLTASTEATSYPKGNLITDNYADVWRSTAAGASAQTVVADFGTATSIGSCALGNVNLRSSATVKIQGHTADAWGAPDVDQTIVTSGLNGYVRCLYHEFTPTSKRYWRISILDDGNPDGFIEIGEWFLGNAITPSDGIDAGIPKKLTRGNIELRTEYNQAYVYPKDYSWQFDLSMTNVQKAAVTELQTLSYYTQGNKLPWFFVIDPTAPAEAYYVRISSDLEVGRVGHDRYNVRFSVAEETPGLIVPRAT